jgi:hypothetical protein
MKASKPKEVVQVKIKNKYTQYAVSNSGNASFVLNSLASNENSDSSGSNKSENTAAQSNISVLNKGKEKLLRLKKAVNYRSLYRMTILMPWTASLKILF